MGTYIFGCIWAGNECTCLPEIAVTCNKSYNYFYFRAMFGPRAVTWASSGTTMRVWMERFMISLIGFDVRYVGKRTGLFIDIISKVIAITDGHLSYRISLTLICYVCLVKPLIATPPRC